MGRRSFIQRSMQRQLNKPTPTGTTPRVEVFAESTGSTNKHAQDVRMGRLKKTLREDGYTVRPVKPYRLYSTNGASTFPTSEQLGHLTPLEQATYEVAYSTINESCSESCGVTITVEDALDGIYGEGKAPPKERIAFQNLASRLNAKLAPFGWRWWSTDHVIVEPL